MTTEQNRNSRNNCLDWEKVKYIRTKQKTRKHPLNAATKKLKYESRSNKQIQHN